MYLCVHVYLHLPEEVPEEEYDPRSLYERLQEQKDKKQEEYEEQFKFSKASVHSSRFHHTVICVAPYLCPYRVKARVCV